MDLLLQVRLLLLAALAGEHILFIGPPGTAKSELGRRLARLYDGQFFERLLTRFSVPEVSSLLVHHNSSSKNPFTNQSAWVPTLCLVAGIVWASEHAGPGRGQVHPADRWVPAQRKGGLH